MRPVEALIQSIEVTFRYPVYFTTGLFEPDNPLLRDTLGEGKALCVVDGGVENARPGLCEEIERHFDTLEGVELVCPPLVIEGGEQVKNGSLQLSVLHDKIHRHAIDRHSYVIAVGGGALLDLAGYAAATAHRGLRMVRIPTTVLAQNDSGVGVKNGVNAFGKKNYLGTFAPPYAVLNDSDFLETLPMRDWISGVSEAVKVALLRDPEFFSYIEHNAAALVGRAISPMRHVIHHCARLHLDHIAGGGDPFEFGSSRPLDFGHWAAHRLEHLSGYTLRHGEAVAVGISLDCTYSHLCGLLSGEQWARILRLFCSLGLPVFSPELAHRALLSGLEEFREHLGGRLTITLLRRIGEGVEVHEMDEELVLESAALLEDFASKGDTRWRNTEAPVRSHSGA